MIEQFAKLEGRVTNLECNSGYIATLLETRLNDFRREVYDCIERETLSRASRDETAYLESEICRLNKTILLYEKLLREYLPYAPEDMNLEELL